MFSSQELSRILFLDIETVRGNNDYSELSPAMQKMWQLKAEKINAREVEALEPEELYRERAGIFAEFGKVVCISFGFLAFKGDKVQLRLKSFFSDNEKELLEDFKKLLDEKFKDWRLCAHNGKEFDFPYLGRRYLIQGIPLPKMLQIQGKKPWELSFLDTMELWKFGDFKSYTKLELLCAAFGIPTPKDDIDGSQVGKVFWEEQDVERIARYCEKDVLATAQVVLKYCVRPLIENEQIYSANFSHSE